MAGSENWSHLLVRDSPGRATEARPLSCLWIRLRTYHISTRMRNSQMAVSSRTVPQAGHSWRGGLRQSRMAPNRIGVTSVTSLRCGTAAAGESTSVLAERQRRTLSGQAETSLGVIETPPPPLVPVDQAVAASGYRSVSRRTTAWLPTSAAQWRRDMPKLSGRCSSGVNSFTTKKLSTCATVSTLEDLTLSSRRGCSRRTSRRWEGSASIMASMVSCRRAVIPWRAANLTVRTTVFRPSSHATQSWSTVSISASRAVAWALVKRTRLLTMRRSSTSTSGTFIDRHGKASVRWK
mmetsp:Transcript_6178/g.17250  ORF Transcript_6178/g.17250 Transcript_6178/m.17250 type:complete len:293 (+) Transcript_6178:869-1747(+)